MKRLTRRHSGVVSASALGLVLALSAAPASGSLGSQMPTDPAEAMKVFEEDVGDWASGPVQYLFLEEERKMWRELRSDSDRSRFITWFWERRDEDLRDNHNPFKEGFYERVAMANRRFSGFPRGWRSDRGRLWIVFGRPDNIRTDLGTELEIWTYSTPGRLLAASSVMGEMLVYFAQVDTAKWEIYGGIGPGAWPAYVLRAIDIVNAALIQNPSLEFRGGRP